mgnify:CR=1 FL=1
MIKNRICLLTLAKLKPLSGLGLTGLLTFNNAGINIQGQDIEDAGGVAINAEFPTSLDDANAPGVALQEIIVRSNLISRNIGDGVRWLNEGGIDGLDQRQTLGGPQEDISSSLTMINNEVPPK